MADVAFDIYVGDGQARPGQRDQLPADSTVHAESGRYLADEALTEAVNIAVAVGQPLLLTGEPGCGKTRLAESVAHELQLGDVLVFQTRSTSKAKDILYHFDAVRRFYDIQTRDDRAEKPVNYVTYGALGTAIVGDKRRIVLIDEIDKAPRDFPNDLLSEIDRMSFEIEELEGDERVKTALLRPIVIITSNTERQLPLPFLRRCVFHHITFPEPDKLVEIVRERLGPENLDGDLIEAAVDQFFKVRKLKGLSKQPATGELLAWLTALHRRAVTASELKAARLTQLPLTAALLKDRDDIRILQDAPA